MKNRKKLSFGLIFSVLLLVVLIPLFPSVILVKAQTGYIDVYVYDETTFNPISGATVVLYDGSYTFLKDVKTDVNGYILFDALDIGDYFLELYPSGYAPNNTMVTIDYEGESELVEFYQKLQYTGGISYIETYIYDNDTLDPIENAKVSLYYELDYSLIDFGYTDIDGFYNLSGFGYGAYVVEATYTGYLTNSSLVFIDYDGEGEYLQLYIEPVSRTITIVTPTDGQTVEGGSVFVEYSVENPIELTTMEVYVNSVLITTIGIYGGLYNECIVPIFNNGTNTIVLEGHWSDLSTGSASVEVNSINVVPVVKLKVGDILNYRQYTIYAETFYDFNFTFISWSTTFEILTQMDFHQYNATDTIIMDQYLMTINVLNGYVSYDTSGMQFLNNHFYPFSSFLPSSDIGDKQAYVPWGGPILLYITGSLTWEYTEVWTVSESSGTLLLYYEKSSNIMYYATVPGMVELNLLVTSIDFLNPNITDLSDFSYTEGDTGNILSWTVTDMNPGLYVLYKDMIEIDTGSWNCDFCITINVDDLAPGSYNYRIIVSDIAGNTIEDTLTITVIALVKEMNPYLCLLFAPIMIFITYVIIRKRKNSIL